MLKEISYKEKFTSIEPWAIFLIKSVKKDLKKEHLRSNPQLVRKYFVRKMVEKLTLEELTEGYLQEVKEGNEEVGDWITSRWMLKNAEIYHFFAEKLAEINPQFDEIEVLDEKQGWELMREAVGIYGSSLTYVFCILNSVAFNEAIYKELREHALAELQSMKESV